MVKIIREACAHMQPEDRTCSKRVAALSLALLVTGVVLSILAAHVFQDYHSLASAAYACLGVGGLVGLAVIIRCRSLMPRQEKVVDMPAQNPPRKLEKPVVIDFDPPPRPENQKVDFLGDWAGRTVYMEPPHPQAIAAWSQHIILSDLQDKARGGYGLIKGKCDGQTDILVKISENRACQCSFTLKIEANRVSYQLHPEVQVVTSICERQVSMGNFDANAIAKIFSSLAEMATFIAFSAPKITLHKETV